MSKQYKQAYLLGDILNKGSKMLREQEAKELREIGIPLYSAVEQNKDGDINDKKNQTVESNNALHSHIYVKDMDNIYKSDLIVACPETFALGSICELGAVEVFNHLWTVINDIVNNPYGSKEWKIERLQDWLKENPHKDVYVHLDDLRDTNIEEQKWNRSHSVNQFVRGCAVSAMNGRGACASNEGVQDIMTWEEIIEKLKGGTVYSENDKSPLEEMEDVVNHYKCYAPKIEKCSSERIKEYDEDSELVDSNQITKRTVKDDISIEPGDLVIIKSWDEMLEIGEVSDGFGIILPTVDSLGLTFVHDMANMCEQTFVVDQVYKHTLINEDRVVHSFDVVSKANSEGLWLLCPSMVREVIKAGSKNV